MLPSLPFLAPSSQLKRTSFIAPAIVILVVLALWSTNKYLSPLSQPQPVQLATGQHGVDSIDSYFLSAVQVGDYMISYPLASSEFGQMGKRLRILKEWMLYTETAALDARQKGAWSLLIEEVVASLVPFIHGPGSQKEHPLGQLRKTFVPGSRGLVIPTGKKHFRFACHLITNLREVVGSNLPIQIAYAGDEDLPTEYRNFAASLTSDVSFFDIKSIFDDKSLDLSNGAWAMKVFAVLGSTFEQVMLLDADVVFLQNPEAIFDHHPSYEQTGTLLFHDRLLWQGGFKERHEWWEKELAHTELSSTIQQSKVYVDKFAEEGDSGVVALDKSRLDVFTGLLHVAWQNTKAVRDDFTYRMGYGDKESWWFGFELTGTPYSIEQHYAAITGHVKLGRTGAPENRVCSFTIAHVDHKDKLLWLNGSLLKNKEINLKEFDVPSEWMIDGTWEKGQTKQDLSCMSGNTVLSIDSDFVSVLQRSVERAEKVDALLRSKIPATVP